MADHPIDVLMKTTMDNIKEMIDVNTILGDPVETVDGTLILPVSRVSVGFAAGGSEFQNAKEGQEGKTRPEGTPDGADFPFGGGAGAGLTISPVAFLVVSMGQVRVMPVEHLGPLDKLIDFVPSFLARGVQDGKQKNIGDVTCRQNIQGDAH